MDAKTAELVGMITSMPREADDPPIGFNRQHSHYFRDVSHIKEIDVYRVLDLFGVVHPCAQHAVKKLLVAGQRGSKNVEQDVREAGDTISRWLQMIAETDR